MYTMANYQGNLLNAGGTKALARVGKVCQPNLAHSWTGGQPRSEEGHVQFVAFSGIDPCPSQTGQAASCVRGPVYRLYQYVVGRLAAVL